jgi:4-diphosphocytidyl-2C-methyl-D-erythritol kinase
LIGDVLAKLRALPTLYAGMSGSGSTCFAVFRDSDTLKKNLKGVEPFFREYNCRLTTAQTYAMS